MPEETKYLILRATPRVAPLFWPHREIQSDIAWKRVVYQSVYVKPDGSGWSLGMDDSMIFPKSQLDKVIELFYESAGPWPFDFEVYVVFPPAKKQLPRRKKKK